MNLLSPVKKLFNRKNLKKIGIGLGIAAATITLGGAIAGVTAGTGPAAGVAGVWGKIASTFGAAATGGAGTAPIAEAATTTVLPAATQAAATPIASPAPFTASTSAFGTGSAAPLTPTGLNAAGSIIPQGGAAGASALSTGAASPNIVNPSLIGAGTPEFGRQALNAAGAGVGSTAFGVQPTGLAREQPVTPAQQTQIANQNLAPGTRSGPFGQPTQPGSAPFTMGPQGSAAGDHQTPSFTGLFDTAKSAVTAGADWFGNLPAITQFALLRGAEGLFTPDIDPVDQQLKLEDRRRRRNRVPRYVGGRFVA